MRTAHVVGYDKSVARIFKKRDWAINENPFISKPDIFVFTGGQDIHPQFYGQKLSSRTHKPSLNRDLMEWGFANAFPEIPKVGICRGGQLLNILNGGFLWQHIEGGHNHHHDMIELATGRIIKTSSLHHQLMSPTNEAEIICVSSTRCHKRYKDSDLVYIPNDDDPEVIWYPKTKCLCLQGHPEYGPNVLEDYFFELINRYLKLPKPTTH